jgi:hypothetical protein
MVEGYTVAMAENESKVQDRCALCGKSLGKVRGRGGSGEKEDIMIIDEVIDGARRLFDTKDCATIFKKFGVVYGSSFYEDICEMPQE